MWENNNELKKSLFKSKVAYSRMLEIFCKNAPQFILQVAILLRQHQDSLPNYAITPSGILKFVQISSSFLSLLLGTISIYRCTPHLTSDEWVSWQKLICMIFFWSISIESIPNEVLRSHIQIKILFDLRWSVSKGRGMRWKYYDAPSYYPHLGAFKRDTILFCISRCIGNFAMPLCSIWILNKKVGLR